MTNRSWTSRARFATLLVPLALVLLAAAPGDPLYRNPQAPVDARVADLLSRMTLEEKLAQVTGLWNKAGSSRRSGSRWSRGECWLRVDVLR